MKKIIHSFLILFFYFLIFGCYQPPKYVCECVFTCKYLDTGEIIESGPTAIGNETIEGTKKACESHAKLFCPGEVISYKCEVLEGYKWKPRETKGRQ